MSTIYVNKNGSDANNGSTAALAKVTISAGITAAGSGGTVIVGSGSYNELISTSMSGCTFYADGNVVIDGQGLSATQLIYYGGYYNPSAAFSWLPYTNGGYWIFKNSPGSSLIAKASQLSGNFTSTYQNCIFLGGGIAYGINYAALGNPCVLTVNKCVFSNFSSQAINAQTYASADTLYITNSTFYNCAIGIYIYHSMGLIGVHSGNIIQNIFSTGTTAISNSQEVLTTALNINNNDYYGYTNFMISGANTYTMAGGISALQALGWELNGMVTNPAFLDTTNAILYPTVNLNPLMQIGAYAFGKTTGSANAGTDTTWKIINALDSPAQSGTGWYNADTNITQDGTTKDLILNAGTSGIIVSPVYDLGSPQFVSSVNIAATQIWAAAGATNGKMIDTTSTDIRPNYQTIRVRGQTTAFNQGDASPSWVEVKSDNTFTTIVARYFQIECTLRGDDVGA